jgi:hypothetical protein
LQAGSAAQIGACRGVLWRLKGHFYFAKRQTF